jgi:hypothetical protein
MNDSIKSWRSFILCLMVRGFIMTMAGWFVVLMIKEAWRFSVAFSLASGLLLTLGVGLLYTLIETWP